MKTKMYIMNSRLRFIYDVKKYQFVGFLILPLKTGNHSNESHFEKYGTNRRGS